MSTTQTAPPPTTADTDTAPAMNAADVEAFAERVLDIISNAATALTLSIGHRTGLFDTMADQPPASSPDIARAGGLHERYVREWLAAMHDGGIVEHDQTDGTWHLPAEHAAVLTRRAGKDNLAKMAQLIGLLAGAERAVATCFRDGGGVPYSAYTEFHALMAEDSKDLAETILVDEVLPLVGGLTQRLERGISVADVGCGSGHHLNVLASTFPDSRFLGYDFSEEAITAARADATTKGLTNVRFELKDVADLTGAGPFDLITAFDAIHDQAHPAAVLDGIARALAPEGVFLMVDIRASSNPHENVGLPGAPFLYGISLLHCMTVSLAQDGAGLGAAWGEQAAVRMLHQAGFGRVDVCAVNGDFINNYYLAHL
jgi:2-polyprenyl-3-methyl-5-hydroxy-6-metoxy-1,4-benzoquinol methylase